MKDREESRPGRSRLNRLTVFGGQGRGGIPSANLLQRFPQQAETRALEIPRKNSVGPISPADELDPEPFVELKVKPFSSAIRKVCTYPPPRGTIFSRPGHKTMSPGGK